MNEFVARPVEAARGMLVQTATFSPDGGSVAFFADGHIRRVDLGGGPPLTICQASPTVLGMSWRGSSLLFATGSAIYRVADTGGTLQQLARFEAGLAAFPLALDDDGTLLYSLASGPELRTRQVILQTSSGSRTGSG